MFQTTNQIMIILDYTYWIILDCIGVRDLMKSIKTGGCIWDDGMSGSDSCRFSLKVIVWWGLVFIRLFLAPSWIVFF